MFKVRIYIGVLLVSVTSGLFATSTSLRIQKAEKLADSLEFYRRDDGAILLNRLSNSRGRLVPYFSNLAALGWVETAKVTPDPAKRDKYLRMTRTWLDWYSVHQNSNGTIYDFEGTPDNLKPTGSYDSTDSYAATYALLLWRYYEASKDKAFVEAKRVSIDGALEAILLTMDDDGLTYAHPHYAYKFLMDNCEVAAGFAALDKLYGLLSDDSKAGECRKHLEKLKSQFARFYKSDGGYFAYAIEPFGVPVGDFSKGYPDAMANLFAITYLAPESNDTKRFLTRIHERFGGREDSQNFPQWWAWPAMICEDQPLTAKAIEQLETQASLDTAHGHLIGIAAATLASGLDGIRFPEVVSTWDELTSQPVVRKAVAPGSSLTPANTRIVITGHKSEGVMPGNEWRKNNVAFPTQIDYVIKAKDGYLQGNLVWPQTMDVSACKGFRLEYESDRQLQVTLIEDDGDWWDAGMPATQPGHNSATIAFDKLTQNPWGKNGDGKPGLSSIKGVRFQVANGDGVAEVKGVLKLKKFDPLLPEIE